MRLIVILILLSACAPKIIKSPNFSEDKIDYIAVLPTEYPSDLQREKVDQIYAKLLTELQSQNFQTLEADLVNRICSDASCPERVDLAERYGATAFLKLNLKTISNINFIAGTYNQIAGEIIISDLMGEELIKVTHAESDRNGLIFNSGQILQGVKTQLNNQSDLIYSKFIKKLVQTIPYQATARNIDTSGQTPEIYSKKIQLVDQRIKICIQSTGDSFSNLIIGSKVIPLREQDIGLHCGLIAAELVANNKPEIEVRSSFGLSTKEKIDLPEIPNCILEKNIIAQNNSPANLIKAACTKLPGSSECEHLPNNCTGHQIIIYSANSSAGPYQQEKILTSATWKDVSANSNYQALNINPYGFPGIPVSVEQK